MMKNRLILLILTLGSISTYGQTIYPSVSINDHYICDGGSTILKPTIDYTDYAGSIFSTSSVTNSSELLDYFHGFAAKFSPGGKAHLVLPGELPTGTIIRFKILPDYAGGSSSTLTVARSLNNSSYSTVGSRTRTYVINQGFEDVTMTLNGSAKYLRFSVSNVNMYIAEVKYDLSNAYSPTFSWSNGATTPSIVVSPSVDTSYWVGVKFGSSIDTVVSQVDINCAKSTSLDCRTLTTSNDTTICPSSLNPIVLNASLQTSGYAEAAVDSTGTVNGVSYSVGKNAGSTHYCKSFTGNFTRVVYRMPCNMPAGTEVCVRISTPANGIGHNSSNWSISGGTSDIVNPSTAVYDQIYQGSQTSPSVTTKYCVTLLRDYEYIAIEDLAGAAFNLHDISYTLPSTTVNYFWSTGDTTSQITVYPTTDSVFSVTTSVGGTSLTAYTHVTTIDAPKVDLQVNDPVFVNTQVLIDGSGSTLPSGGSFTYSWEKDSSSVGSWNYDTLSVLYTDTVTYALTIQDGNTGCSDRGKITLIKSETLNRITGTVFLDSDLDGVWDGNENGTDQVLVLLYRDNNSDGILNPGDVFLDSISTDSSGFYSFEVSYTGGTESFFLEIDTTTIGGTAIMTTDNVELATFSSGGNIDPNNDFGHNCSLNSGIAGPISGCAKEDQIFAVSPAISGAAYTWSFNDNYTTTSSSNSPTQEVQWDTSGSYTVTLVVNYLGCIDSFTHTIGMNSAVYAIATPADTLCRGGSATLDGTSSSPGVDFAWTVESGDPFSIDTGTTSSQPSVSPYLTTVYKMTVTNQTNGCSTSEFVTVNVDVQLNPTASLAVPGIVSDSTIILLDGSGSSAPIGNSSATLTYSWFDNGSIIGNGPNDTLSTLVTDTTIFSLVVADSSNGCTDTAYATVQPITTPVPVEFVRVIAEANQTGDVEVSWATAMELNNAYFAVERRYEYETQFTEIGKQDGSGNSSSLINYSFIDKTNLWLSPYVYYRIKQIDYDGTTDYSYAVSVSKIGQDELELMVYPNPAQNEATIYVSEIGKIKIYDGLGNEISSEILSVDQEGFYTADLGSLRNGTYIIKGTSNSQVVVKRLSVSR